MTSASLPAFEISGRRIWVAGHRGLLGRALVHRLGELGAEVVVAGRETLDLTQQGDVIDWVASERPDAAIIAAAKVGGIQANATYPADFLRENLLIGVNCVEAAYRAGVTKLVAVASAAVYPKDAAQPVAESALMSGPVEPAHEPYAVAKIAQIKLCEAYQRQYGARFVATCPTNSYGPGDNFDLANSHVVPALIRKADEAKRSGASELVVWGSGRARREFIHAADCADALVHVLAHYEVPEPLNIGTGADHTIAELVEMISRTVGFEGRIVLDRTKPDGPARRLLDTTRLRALGWAPSRSLDDGLAETYAWYRAAIGAGTLRT